MPGRSRRPSTSGSAVIVAVLITSASATASASESTTVAPATAATASAFARVRFQTSTRSSDGRTARWAAMRCGASPPAPTINSVVASSRARNRAPRAESAAVLR